MGIDNLLLKKEPISVEEYFAKNGINNKQFPELSPEQSKFNSESRKNNLPDPEYYVGQYRTGIDDVFDCLDYPVNREFFDIVLKHIRDSSDILEVGCGSGLLGNYILLSNKNYRGIDSCPEAVDKAKSRAEFNGNNADFFSVQNMMIHNDKHHFIMGKNILHDKYSNPKRDLINHLMDLSDNLIFIQSFGESYWFKDYAISFYRGIFKEKGFSLEVLSDFVPINSCPANSMVFLASNK